MRRKLSSANVISLVALFFALTGGAVYAAGKIGSKQIKPNAVKSKHIGPDKATGKDILESSLGMVPRALDATSAQHADTAESANTAQRADTATSADSAQSAQTAQSAVTAQSATSAQTSNSVGGVSIESVRVAHADPANPEDPANRILSVAGNQVGVGCFALAQLNVAQGVGAAPLYYESHRAGQAETVVLFDAGAGLIQGFSAGSFTVTIREASGRVTNLDLDGFRSTNAFGGPEDCFFQGTISRYG